MKTVTLAVMFAALLLIPCVSFAGAEQAPSPLVIRPGLEDLDPTFSHMVILISGTVTDLSGSPVSGATVHITFSNNTKTVKTDQYGNFEYRTLKNHRAPAVYITSVSAAETGYSDSTYTFSYYLGKVGSRFTDYVGGIMGDVGGHVSAFPLMAGNYTVYLGMLESASSSNGHCAVKAFGVNDTVTAYDCHAAVSGSDHGAESLPSSHMMVSLVQSGNESRAFSPSVYYDIIMMDPSQVMHYLNGIWHGRS